MVSVPWNNCLSRSNVSRRRSLISALLMASGARVKAYVDEVPESTANLYSKLQCTAPPRHPVAYVPVVDYNTYRY
jgi:hypothetical protein